MRPFRRGPYEISLMSSKREKEELFELVPRVDRNWVGGMRSLYYDNPGFRARYCLLVRREGRLAAHAMCFQHRCRIGGGTVRAGRIHWVCVDPAIQRGGLGKLMMQTWLRVMRERGVPLSWLWGIRSYYGRFHYYYGCPWTRPAEGHLATIPARRIPRYAGRLKIAPLRRGDIEAARGLFGRTTRDTTLEPVHSPAIMRFLLDIRRRARNPLLAVRRGRTLEGFFVESPLRQHVTASLVCTAGREADHAVLSRLAATARRRGARQVALYVPLDRPVALLLWEMGGSFLCPHSLDIAGGTMVRLLDPAALFRAMEPQLLPRLLSLGPKESAKGIAVVSSVGAVALRAVAGRLRATRAIPRGMPRARLSAEALTQMTVGYFGYRDLAARGAVPARGRSAEVLALLFPRLHPFVSLSI